MKLSITSITGRKIVTPGETITDCTILWDDDGVIQSVSPRTPINAKEPLAFPESIICPGFINLHVHGGFGVDTMDASNESLSTLALNQAQQGVTGFLPTTTTASCQAITNALKSIKTYMENPSDKGALVLGAHVEGPYLNPAKAGAQNPAFLHAPDWQEFLGWYAAAGGAIRILSLAPERDPNGTFVARAADLGVIVSAAHTDATYEQANTAISQGLRHATHTFNAMSRFDYRAPRILEALLLDDHISLEIIPDCTEIPHIHPAAIKMLKRIAGVDRLCTITDAVAAAGMDDGVYSLGDKRVRKRGDIAFLEGMFTEKGVIQLAGSVLQMNRGIANLVEKADFTLAEAVQTATLNPARALGMDNLVGSLASGKFADITVLDAATYAVQAVFVCGQRIV